MAIVEKKQNEMSDKLPKNIMKPRFAGKDRKEPSEFEERVIEVRRVARTVKGGRRIRFRSLVVIGNKKGKVGMGIAKANDVAEATRKAIAQAKKNVIIVPIVNGTIPYETISKFGSAVVMLKPASSGTSIVAGGSVRAVADLAGITDLLSKMMGSANKVNNIVATLKAFASFNPEYTNKIKKMVEETKAVVAEKSEEKKEVAKPKASEKKEPAKALKTKSEKKTK